MDKALLAYSLHCSGSRSSEPMKELNDMLSSSTDALEQLVIQKEIGELQQVSCIACVSAVALRSHPRSALHTADIDLAREATPTFGLRWHHTRQSTADVLATRSEAAHGHEQQRIGPVIDFHQ